MWLLRYYPITILVIAPYAVLVAPSAIFFGNPDKDFVLWLLFVVTATVAVTETVVRLLARGGVRRTDRSGSRVFDYPKAFAVARTVAVASMVADVAAVLAGQGTIVTQLTGRLTSSWVAPMATMFSGWRYLAIGLLLHAVVVGHARVSSFYRWAAVLVATQLFILSLTALTASMIAYLTFICSLAAVTGVIRARHIAIVMAALFLAWPSLFALRNEIRQAGGVVVSKQVTAATRLRVDLQMSRLSTFDVPVDIGQPGIVEALRYGFVPRVIDQDRPPMATGAKINLFLGGSPTSAYSFLEIGNVYFLGGLTGLIIFYSVCSAVAALLLKRWESGGPFSLCLLGFAIAGPLNWASTYPDALIGTFQSILAAAPVFLFLHASRVPGDSGGARPPGRLDAARRPRRSLPR